MLVPDINNSKPLGRGLSSLKGDTPPPLPATLGDSDPGLPYLPGNMRMAGSKIKGIMQIDPTFIKKHFPG